MPSSAPGSGMVLFPPALHSLPLPFESHPSKKYRHPDGCLYFLAERVGFEPTSPLLDYLISSVVKLWQIHVWSRSFQATLLRGRNADAARGCGHSDPYRPEAIRTAPKFK